MKQRNLKKKICSLILTVGLTITFFSVYGTEGYAAESLDSTQFATVDELKVFNTNDQDGKNPAKVYFGNNNQQWWIAGSQHEKGLTLFAATPLATKQMYEPNAFADKAYDSRWNCTYLDELPSMVYANHYGASPLRNTLQAMETNYFTDVEKGLMNETTIYTKDLKNDTVYSTKDKLYLAYRETVDYITVGANESDMQNLNSGLRVDMDYWGEHVFWLRTPYDEGSTIGFAISVAGIGHLNRDVTDNVLAIEPAFELNLSSVLFASAAPAATTDGNLSLADTDGDGAFTLRYRTNNLGSAFVSSKKDKVTLTNVPSGTYLVVQNGQKAYAKSITEGVTSVSASEMGFTDLTNCKVWLEKTDSNERITYATLANNQQSYNVNISLSDGMEAATSNLTQIVNENQPIDNIIIKTKDGYMFPIDYNFRQQNGIMVRRDSENQITILGTPTADVDITLPSPAQRTYTITANPASLSFDTKNEGYSVNELSQSVAVTNTGNSRVTLQMPSSSYYDISLSTMELEPNGTAILTVTPKANLSSGVYNETIEINTTKNTLASVNVSFKVHGALYVSLDASATNIIEGESVILTAGAEGGSGHYTYSWYENDVENSILQGNQVTVTPAVTTTYKVMITDAIENKSATATITVTPRRYVLEVPTNFTFDKQHVGYENISSKSFSFKNTGNVDITNINVALTGTGADAFTLNTAGTRTILHPNEITSFTVNPVSNLKSGTYTTIVQISGEKGVSKLFEISFIVEDHDYVSVVTKPSCTSKGYTTYTCKICNHSYIDNETEILPHEYGEEWKSNETGHWKECKNCGFKSQVQAHSFVWVVDKNTTETGSKHEECSICGYKKASVEIPLETLGNLNKPNVNNTNNDKGSVETGDKTNIFVWKLSLIGSSVILLYALYRKKRKI